MLNWNWIIKLGLILLKYKNLLHLSFHQQYLQPKLLKIRLSKNIVSSEVG